MSAGPEDNSPFLIFAGPAASLVDCMSNDVVNDLRDCFLTSLTMGRSIGCGCC